MTAAAIDAGTRRDFLFVATGTAGAIALVGSAWPLIDQMSPSTAILALVSTEVDLSSIQPGQQVITKWRGQALFVRRRTPVEIAASRAVEIASLPDPLARNANLPETATASDAERAARPEWLVLVGVCTHMGCVPQASTPQAPEGEYGGWLCHCHGSQYDTAGRIRKGPAPRNLAVPPYAFLSDTHIKVG